MLVKNNNKGALGLINKMEFTDYTERDGWQILRITTDETPLLGREKFYDNVRFRMASFTDIQGLIPIFKVGYFMFHTLTGHNYRLELSVHDA